jgi:D-alanine transaminase
MNIVFLNGEFINKSKASISIMDRGFLFGDGVYEVIPYANNNSIGLEPHLLRLEKSLQAIQINSPYSAQEWKEILQKLIKHNTNLEPDFSIYIQITRGQTEFRAHAFPEKVQPTVVAFCTPPKKQQANYDNFKAITLKDERHYPCHIKSTNLLANLLAYNKALQQQAVEAILHDGKNITEGTSSSVFIVKDHKITSPPLSDRILPGITRSIIIEIINNNNLNFTEQIISLEELNAADEIWICSSTKPIYPISTLNDKTVGLGKPGPMWRKIIGLYQKHNLGMTL